MRRIGKIFWAWLRALARRPLELRIAWLLTLTGSALLGGSMVGATLAAFAEWANLPILVKIAILFGMGDWVRLVLGALLCLLGFYMAYVSVLSPKIKRTRARLRLASLLSSTNRDNLAIATTFEEAFSYTAPVDAVALLATAQDPIGRALDYKWARALIATATTRFIPIAGYDQPLQRSKKSEHLYYVLSFLAIAVFAFGVEPWSPQSSKPIFVLLGLALGASCIPILHSIRRLHALSRLVAS